jgi:phenylalanine ammonia-lyase
MALVSGRQTINSLDILSILIASHLYALCQALDLRAMYKELVEGVNTIASEELASTWGALLSQRDLAAITATVCSELSAVLEQTTTMDAADRMQQVAGATSSLLIDFFTARSTIPPEQLGSVLALISPFRSKLSSRSAALLGQLRHAYLFGERGQAPASRYLNKTRPVYEFVRVSLGIKMHGSENYLQFPNGHGVDEQTTGQNISLIYEAIRDGALQPVIVKLFSQ